MAILEWPTTDAGQGQRLQWERACQPAVVPLPVRRASRIGPSEAFLEPSVMPIHDFADLLQAALQQSEPQRLLLVFAVAELPRDATDKEKTEFARGEGGALAPKVCVDKRPEDIESFAALVDESRQTEVDWDILFVSALSGRGGFAPNPDEAVQPLRMMVEAIKGGRVGEFLAVDRNGELVELKSC